MAKQGQIVVKGVEDALKNFKRVNDVFAVQALKNTLFYAAKIVRDAAKNLCPVGTGTTRSGKKRQHLRDLIFAARGTDIGPVYEASVIVGVDRKKAPHAHLVEFGHQGKSPAPAHPYLRPAIDQNRERVVSAVENKLKGLLDQVQNTF